MRSWASAIVRGAAAGAAGTTVLNAVTYADMAVRGRPSSSTPEQSVERLAQTVGVQVPGSEDTRSNRVAGLGPLLGIATGVAVGGLVGLLARRRLSLPALSAAAATAALVGSNAPMTVLRITDPRTWSAADWVSDVVPHVAYGVVTAAVAGGLVRGPVRD